MPAINVRRIKLRRRSPAAPGPSAIKKPAGESFLLRPLPSGDHENEFLSLDGRMLGFVDAVGASEPSF
jgi:hypothetical protein